jgi:TATA-box binding protein (TBP) (component of TFIID and TFIIIB)
MVCTGAKSEKEARRAVMKVTKELKKGGIIIISKPELKIQNIVASASLGGMIDLEKAAYTLGKTMYEPEQFPGLIYRMDEPKVWSSYCLQAENLFAQEQRKKQMVILQCTSFMEYLRSRI